MARDRHRLSPRLTPQTLRTCDECGKKFWASKDYTRCWECVNKVGAEVVVNGFTYVKLAEDDPHYGMCPKAVGFFGKGWVRKSRYVMAQQLGRDLTEDEQVYHRNRVKSDDNPENLYLHTIQHRSEEDVRKFRSYKFGYEEGYEEGLAQSYDEGYAQGHKEGYKEGYEKGWNDYVKSL